MRQPIRRRAHGAVRHGQIVQQVHDAAVDVLQREALENRAPTKAAAELGVAISTVRTQIHSIRMKTGASSIGALVRQVAALPPPVRVLRAPQPV